jgi:DNA-binding GntR family transcriptional regulator
MLRVEQPNRRWREQLRHDVAAVIRGHILTGQARPGEIIRTAPIAAEMDISITPVREALLMLAQDGWLVQEPNRGFRVAPLRPQDITDIYTMWGLAEGELAARAAIRVTPADTANLRYLNARLLELTDPSDGERAVEANRELHTAIRRLADAPKIEWFAHAARRLVPYDFSFEFHRIPGWWDLNRIGHTTIIEAIAAGDRAQALARMKTHMIDTGDLLVAWLDSVGFWAPDAAHLAG